MASGVSKGAVGELLAARFLRKKGYTVLTANYRCRFGEIDIIAAKKPYIAFVEVKQRGKDALYRPCEAVTREKQRRLIRTALHYLQQVPSDDQPRFDVIEVVTADDNPLKNFRIRHMENAFEAEDCHEVF